MLHLHTLPLKLWAEAVHTVIYLLNRTINREVGYITPFELWFKTKPVVSHYRTFGTLAYIFIDKSLRTKFQSNGTQVIFVGYSATSKGWRFWHPLTNRVSESSDVIFDEATGYSPSLFSSNQPSSVPIPTPLLVHTMPPPHNLIPTSSFIPSSDSVGAPIPTNYVSSFDDQLSETPLPQDPQPIHPSDHNTEEITSLPDTEDLPPSSSPVPLPTIEEPAHPKYRSLNNIYSASTPIESVPSHSTTKYANMIHAAESYRELATYKQATMSPQAAY